MTRNCCCRLRALRNSCTDVAASKRQGHAAASASSATARDCRCHLRALRNSCTGMVLKTEVVQQLCVDHVESIQHEAMASDERRHPGPPKAPPAAGMIAHKRGLVHTGAPALLLLPPPSQGQLHARGFVHTGAHQQGHAAASTASVVAHDCCFYLCPLRDSCTSVALCTQVLQQGHAAASTASMMAHDCCFCLRPLRDSCSSVALCTQVHQQGHAAASTASMMAHDCCFCLRPLRDSCTR
eukprot:1152185-Pelagomonas_calceolata.AAC.1